MGSLFAKPFYEDTEGNHMSKFLRKLDFGEQKAFRE